MTGVLPLFSIEPEMEVAGVVKFAVSGVIVTSEEGGSAIGASHRYLTPGILLLGWRVNEDPLHTLSLVLVIVEVISTGLIPMVVSTVSVQ